MPPRPRSRRSAAILLAQFDPERVFAAQLVLDHQRQVPDPALNPQGVVVGHHRGVDHHGHGGGLRAILLQQALAQLPERGHELRVQKALGPQRLDQKASGLIALAGVLAGGLPLLLAADLPQPCIARITARAFLRSS